MTWRIMPIRTLPRAISRCFCNVRGFAKKDFLRFWTRMYTEQYQVNTPQDHSHYCRLRQTIRFVPACPKVAFSSKNTHHTRRESDSDFAFTSTYICGYHEWQRLSAHNTIFWSVSILNTHTESVSKCHQGFASYEIRLFPQFKIQQLYCCQN